MAHRLQRLQIALALWCVLAAAPVLAGATFSHRVHLAKKLDCPVCHTAASGSTKAADNLLPKPEVCAGCHKPEYGKLVKAAPRTPAVAFFNHQIHVRMGAAVPGAIAKAIDSKAYLTDGSGIRKFLDTRSACRGCHRGLEFSDEVSAEAYPRMADCLVCHNKIDPPFSCKKCHTEAVQLKPASHTADWVDTHSAGKVKDKSGCAVCHGRGFTCQGCH